MSTRFEVKGGNDGKCISCRTVPGQNESVQCYDCKGNFHIFCPNISLDEKVAAKSTVTSFLAASTKKNFVFFCDNCLTNFEINKATDESKKVSLLESKMSKMEAKLDEISTLLTKSQKNECIQSNPESIWNDKERVDALKNNSKHILIVKNSDDGTEKVENKKVLEDIVKKNKVPLKNAYENNSGNLVIVCDSSEDCNDLKTLVSENHSHISLDTPPTVRSHIVSIVGLDIEYAVDEFSDLFASQNSGIKCLSESVNFKEHFKVRAIKPLKNNTTQFQAFCSVSSTLREVIQKSNNKVMIGLCVCKVYDQSNIRRCYNCQHFGHFSSSCPTSNKTACANCAGEHSTKECVSTIKKCINCERNNFENLGHSASYHDCPSLIQAKVPGQKSIQSKTSLNC